MHYNCDNVFADADLGRVVERHRAGDGADATLLVERVGRDVARTTGVCELADGDEGRVVGLVEKSEAPPSTLALTGVFVFSHRIFSACRAIEPSARGSTSSPTPSSGCWARPARTGATSGSSNSTAGGGTSTSRRT